MKEAQTLIEAWRRYPASPPPLLPHRHNYFLTPTESIPVKLKKSIALVTGAPSGVGKATTERLAMTSCKAYGTSRRRVDGPL